MNALTLVAAREFVYINIPAEDIRVFAEDAFPGFAKYPAADSISGSLHRWKGGHDILLNVPDTLFTKGPREATLHLGHILLTDFPTRAGIPIPGFSQSGLGGFLAEAGINKGWLNISFFDSTIGIFAVSSGSKNLIKALEGTLFMNSSTFFDTFVGGSLEVTVSFLLHNPFLLIGGFEKIVAGIISTYKTFTLNINPVYFFGSAFAGAIIGMGLSYLISPDRDIRYYLMEGLKSAAISSLSSIDKALGFAAAGGIAMFQLGKVIAEKYNKESQAILNIDRNSFDLLMKELRDLWGSEFEVMWDAINSPLENLESLPQLLPCGIELLDDKVD